MREQLIGIWKGTCHSNVPVGRRINQSLSHQPEIRIGPEPKFWTSVQLTKNELKNGAQGHSNSQTGRVIKDNYVRKSVEGRQRGGLESEAEYQETDFKRYVGIAFKAQEEGHNCDNDTLGQKGVCVFS